MRTLVEFEDLLQPMIVSILGWDLESPNKSEDIRIGYQFSGPPASGKTEDVVYIKASPSDDPINRQHDVLVENSSPGVLITKGMTRVMALNFVAYGPTAYDNLKTISVGMFSDSIRNQLKAEEVYFIPDFKEPSRMPESFQGEWWERADLTLYFNELLTSPQESNNVESVDVTVENSTGVKTEFTID